MNPLWLIIHAVFGTVSWILYAVVTKYIYAHRKQFNAAFLRLWNTFTIINLLQFISMKLYYQIPLHIPSSSSIAPYIESFPYQQPMTILYFLAYYFIYCQRICVILIISISFRVIVFPFSSSPIWERQYIVTTIIIFLTPIPFIYNVLFMEPSYNYSPLMDGYILYPALDKHPQVAVRNLLQSNFFEISTAVISGVLKLSTLFCLNSSSMRKRDDRNLYVVTTVLFAASLLKFACAILLVFKLDELILQISIYLYPITADIVALSCPYSLLYINKRMRKSIFNFKILRKSEDTNGTSV